MLDKNSSVPLYEQLKNVIKRDIDAKVYLPGDKMLSEGELEEKYKVSRITVRRAIKELCEEAVLVRKQGKGTFVLKTRLKNRIDGIGGFHDVMEESDKKVEVKLLEKSVIPIKEIYAKYLGINKDEEVLYIKRVMYADDVAIMIDECYIPLERFPDIQNKIIGNFSVFRILQEQYKVHLSNYYKELKIQKATKEMARYLQIRMGEPVFNLFKISYDKTDEPVHISNSIILAENTSYVIATDEDNRAVYSGLNWMI